MPFGMASNPNPANPHRKRDKPNTTPEIVHQLNAYTAQAGALHANPGKWCPITRSEHVCSGIPVV